MAGSYLSYVLVAALAIALVYAAFTDIRRREIANHLNLGIALAAPLWWFAAGLGWQAIAVQLGLALLTFAITCGLFALRQMGGGDVKLLTALALWFLPGPFLQMVVLMAVIGGGGSIAMAACNMQREPGESGRDILAALAAILWIAGVAAIIFTIASGKPLITAMPVSEWSLSPWLVLLFLAAVLALLLTGFRQIMRRQKSRLRVPYGVAIAASALWMLGQQAVLQTPLHQIG